MRRLLIAAIVMGAGLFAPPTSAQIGLGLSIPEVAVRQRGTGGGATPCNAGQLDWSVATGCNLTLYMIGIR